MGSPWSQPEAALGFPLPCKLIYHAFFLRALQK